MRIQDDKKGKEGGEWFKEGTNNKTYKIRGRHSGELGGRVEVAEGRGRCGKVKGRKQAEGSEKLLCIEKRLLIFEGWTLPSLEIRDSS